MPEHDKHDDVEFETPVEETARRILFAIGIVVAALVVWLMFG